MSLTLADSRPQGARIPTMPRVGRKKLSSVAKRALVLATVLIAGTAAVGTAALASARSYTVGDPQPELALFNVGAAGGGSGSGVVLPDGTLVLVSPSHSGTTAAVCRLHPGNRRCASTATLKAYKGGGHQDGFGGVAEVLATGGTDVSVVLEDCCYIPNPHGGGAVVFNSTNDGRTFSKEIPAGDIGGVDAATFADGQVVVGPSSTGSFEVQAFPTKPATVVTSFAVPNSREDGDTSLTTYHGGVLVASDDTNGNTLVEYAPSGTKFNSTSSYHSVGIFKGQDLAAVSGSALLTYSANSLTHGAFLRFFNGKTFGSAHRVPEPATGDDGYWNLQETGAVAHVFFLNRRHGYDIYSESTGDGLRWSPLTIYNTAVTSSSLMPVLGLSGAGLLYETDSKPLLAQPILNAQWVAIKLAASRVYIGTPTLLSGQAAPHLTGQVVTLEKLSTGRWYNVATTHESSAGKFSFAVPGTTETYRAVVSYEPGYYLYGYSNHVLLTAVPRPKNG
ncbi:MAG: hypothetical protein WAV54_06565 [Acidimicrobiales bacterium]